MTQNKDMAQSIRTSDECADTAVESRVCADGGLWMLKEHQRKDAEEVAAGLRDPRSLWVVGKGDLKGFRFTQNPASKFATPGSGWGNLVTDGRNLDHINK